MSTDLLAQRGQVRIVAGLIAPATAPPCCVGLPRRAAAASCISRYFISQS
jgi:hypothetical protein